VDSGESRKKYNDFLQILKLLIFVKKEKKRNHLPQTPSYKIDSIVLRTIEKEKKKDP
jgi:acyl-coenzyme A synthetase/AMP-(fatty) acid ligase